MQVLTFQNPDLNKKYPEFVSLFKKTKQNKPQTSKGLV